MLDGRILAAVALLCAMPAGASPAEPSTTTRHLVGLNVGTPDIWNRGNHYADAFRTSLPFEGVPVDSLGWPAGDFSVEVLGGNVYLNGTYALSFTGQATNVFVDSGSGSISGIEPGR